MSKLILTLYIVTTSVGLIILKLGTKSGMPVSYSGDKVHFNLNYYTIGGILLYALSFALYTYLISKFDLGYIIPLAAAFVYILIFVGSYFVFKETFSATKMAGIVLIVGGLIFLNLS